MPRYRYIKMTPGEISEALKQTGLSVGQFSRLIGARYNGPNDSTVQKWLDGKQDAPTYLPVLFALQYALMDREWAWPFTLLAETGGTVAVCLLSYHALVQRTQLRRFVSWARNRPCPDYLAPHHSQRVGRRA